MIRLCVSCRTRRPQRLLFPFHRGEKNELLLGAGTSLGMSPKGVSCDLHKKPHLASRSFEKKGFHANTCLEQVQYKNKCDISTHLRSSVQSGVVYSGRAKVLNNQHKIDFLSSALNLPSLPTPLMLFKDFHPKQNFSTSIVLKY